ncbi:MAG: VCBS repeat-containing protein [Verrucomicrobia bacterium]|nr:VCBS repeat-containing protein [Verrucomicrobiota bacterium]MDA1067606.1 VCBS repeat-containing protein [Verrucomicrobiota bacterium]
MISIKKAFCALKPNRFLGLILLILPAASLAVLSGATVEKPNVAILKGPHVTTLDWNTRAPRFADINGDGKQDIALINNGKAKIEFLIQKNEETQVRKIGNATSSNKWEPKLEDDWFEKRFLVIEQTAYDLALNDFNNDGRIDLVVTGNRDSLSIYLQDKKGEFEQSWTYDEFTPKQRGETIVVSDLNQDGEPDIMTIGTEKILILLKAKKSLNFEITEYYVGENAAWNLQTADLNLDGLPDLIYYHSNQSAQFLAVRLQTEPGKFGPEIPIDFGSAIFKQLPTSKSEKPNFIFSESRTGQVKTFSISQENVQQSDPFNALQTYTYPLNSTIRKSALYTWGDLNGDKRTDLIVGDSEGAQIQVFLQDKSGLFSTQKNFPSFAFLDGVSVLQHPKTKKPVIFQISQKERLAGISQMTKEGELPFPTLLPLEGEPIAILNNHEASKDFQGLILIEKLKREYHLTEYNLDNEGEWKATRILIKELKNEPRGLALAYFEKDTPFLVVLAQREGAIFLKQGEEGWEETGTESALRKTLLYDLASDRINFSDMNGDGIDELFIADTGFLRKISYDTKKADFIIEEQFNTPKRKQDARLPIPYKKEDTQGIVYFDPKDDHIYWTGKSGVSLLQGNNQKELPPLTPIIGRHIDLGKGKSALLIGGEKRFYLIPDEGELWNIDVDSSYYEPETDEVRYSYLFVSNRLDNGKSGIIGIDPQVHVLELFSRSQENEYSQVLEFTLFDQTAQRGNQQVNYQPRDAGINDLNGDGRDDIVLLVHDRMLIYY